MGIQTKTMVAPTGTIVKMAKTPRAKVALVNDSVALIDFCAPTYTWEPAWEKFIGEVLDVQVRQAGLPRPTGDLYDISTWLVANGLRIRRGYKVSGKLPPHRSWLARYRLEIENDD